MFLYYLLFSYIELFYITLIVIAVNNIFMLVASPIYKNPIYYIIQHANALLNVIVDNYMPNYITNNKFYPIYLVVLLNY